ncbi:hypothetical protein [Elizabethkingia meningoseptica]|uniref:hypothetical protein n=1 Tax=Elizabethkingia meningoseptica TaxID=238 RepID=UPI0037C09585
MPSHIHTLFRSEKGEPSELIRDFKGFAARTLLKTIEKNSQESRHEKFKCQETPVLATK